MDFGRRSPLSVVPVLGIMIAFIIAVFVLVVQAKGKWYGLIELTYLTSYLIFIQHCCTITHFVAAHNSNREDTQQSMYTSNAARMVRSYIYIYTVYELVFVHLYPQVQVMIYD